MRALTSAFVRPLLLLVAALAAAVPPLEAALPELPRVPEIVRFNQTPFAKRLYGKVIAGGFGGRSFVGRARALGSRILDGLQLLELALHDVGRGTAGGVPANAGFAYLGQREITAPNFAAGKDRSEALPKENVVSRLISRLDYDYSVAGGTGAGDVLADAAFRTHDVVHVERKGSVIMNVLGQTLGKYWRLFGDEDMPQTDPGDDADGQDDDDRVARVPVPFDVLRAFDGDAFAVYTRLGNAVNFHVKGGLAQSLLTDAADGAASFDSTELLLIEQAIKDVEEDPAERWGLKIMRKIEKTFSADQTLRIPIEHLISGWPLARVLIEAQDNGASGDQFQYSDTAVTRGKLRMGATDVFEDFAWSDMQARNKAVYGLSAVETGVIALDFAEDRRIWPGHLPWVGAGEAPTLELETDHDAAAGDHRVVVTTEQLLYPKPWMDAWKAGRRWS